MGVPAKFNQLRYMPMTDGRWLNDLTTLKSGPSWCWAMNRAVSCSGTPVGRSTILLNEIRFR